MKCEITEGISKPGKGGKEYISIIIIPMKYNNEIKGCRSTGRQETLRILNATSTDVVDIKNKIRGAL